MDRLRRIVDLAWEWRRMIVMTALWYGGLVYFRDQLGMGEFYLLASGFWVIYLIGFSPREPGELSAYAHFNENSERILGDMDPRRAGRELTGQIFFDDDTSRQRRPNGGANGHQLGASRQQEEEEDADLQRALLLSLREEREARAKRQ